MSKPTLIIVTSKTCSACRNFKATTGPTLLANLRRDNRIQVAEIDLDTMSSPIPATYPRELKRFIGWYPTFILLAPMTGQTLEGVVFNGDMSRGHVSGPDGRRPMTVDGITNWLNEQLTTNPLFSKPASQRLIYRPSNY